jgi:hypothetical protein
MLVKRKRETRMTVDGGSENRLCEAKKKGHLGSVKVGTKSNTPSILWSYIPRHCLLEDLCFDVIEPHDTIQFWTTRSSKVALFGIHEKTLVLGFSWRYVIPVQVSSD